MFKHARLPKDSHLLARIDEAAVRLARKLNGLDVMSLPISDYIKRYTTDHLKHLRTTLQRYAYILSWALYEHVVPLERFVMIDYGAGCGILGMLAKETGVGTVIYEDIYHVSCRDAHVLARALGNEASHYVHGDMDAVVEYLERHWIDCHAIVSYDVIEHVYDIEAFLARLADLPGALVTAVMVSGANARNPRVRKHLEAVHRQCEHQGQERAWGHKERDCTKPYLEARREIIAAYEPGLSPAEVACLAEATRGLIVSGIHQAVDEYRRIGPPPASRATRQIHAIHTRAIGRKGSWTVAISPTSCHRPGSR